MREPPFSQKCVFNLHAINFLIWSVGRVSTATWWLEKNTYWFKVLCERFAACMCVFACLCVYLLTLHDAPCKQCSCVAKAPHVVSTAAACLQGCSALLGGDLQRWWDWKLNSFSGSHHQASGGQEINCFPLSTVLSMFHFLACFSTFQQSLFFFYFSVFMTSFHSSLLIFYLHLVHAALMFFFFFDVSTASVCFSPSLLCSPTFICQHFKFLSLNITYRVPTKQIEERLKIKMKIKLLKK